MEHGAIKMVRISDIQENCVLWDNVPYCKIEENDIDTYLLKVNDILFARTGGTVGKSFLVEEVPERAIYAGYLIRTRYSSLLNPRYMKFFMESQLYWEQLKNGTIATAQPNCNGKTLAKSFKRIFPFITNRNSSASIIFISITVWIKAPLLYPTPYFIYFLIVFLILGGGDNTGTVCSMSDDIHTIYRIVRILNINNSVVT